MVHAISGTLGVDLTAATTTATFNLAQRQEANNGAVYEYVKASAAVAQYAALKIDNDGTCAELTTTLSGAEPTRVGVAQTALAINEYGWVVVRGPLTVLTAAAAVVDAKLYTTATAGKVDDDSALSDAIQGLALAAAAVGAAATAAFATTFMTTNAET